MSDAGLRRATEGDLPSILGLNRVGNGEDIEVEMDVAFRFGAMNPSDYAVAVAGRPGCGNRGPAGDPAEAGIGRPAGRPARVCRHRPRLPGPGFGGRAAANGSRVVRGAGRLGAGHHRHPVLLPPVRVLVRTCPRPRDRRCARAGHGNASGVGGPRRRSGRRRAHPGAADVGAVRGRLGATVRRQSVAGVSRDGGGAAVGRDVRWPASRPSPGSVSIPIVCRVVRCTSRPWRRRRLRR